MNNQTGCDFEPQVVESLRKGLTSEELKTHLDSCRDCRETRRVMNFFQAAAAADCAPKLPTAGLVWWKSKQREKHLASERIARTNLITQIVAVVFAFVALITLIILRPDYFASVAAIFDQTFAVIEQSAIYLFSSFLVLALISIVTFFALKRISAKD